MPKGSWLEYPVSRRERGEELCCAGQAKCGQLEQLYPPPPDLPLPSLPNHPTHTCREHVHCSVAQAVTPRLALFLSPSPSPVLTASLLSLVSYLSMKYRHRVTRGRSGMCRTESSLRCCCCCPPKRSDASKCRRTSPANGANLDMEQGGGGGGIGEGESGRQRE